MSDVATMRTADVATFPVKRRHRWVKWDTHVLPSESDSGCEEHRSTCQHCNIVKTTFIPPSGRYQDIYRRWRLPDGTEFGYQPPCSGMKEGEW